MTSAKSAGVTDLGHVTDALTDLVALVYDCPYRGRTECAAQGELGGCADNDWCRHYRTLSADLQRVLEKEEANYLRWEEATDDHGNLRPGAHDPCEDGARTAIVAVLTGESREGWLAVFAAVHVVWKWQQAQGWNVRV